MTHIQYTTIAPYHRHRNAQMHDRQDSNANHRGIVTSAVVAVAVALFSGKFVGLKFIASCNYSC